MQFNLADITITKEEAENLGIVSGLGLVHKDIYKSINKQILDLINSGEELPWRKPWRDGYKHKGISYGPQNYVTGNPYRGANAFTMWLYNFKNGTEQIYFLTKKQIAERGGKILSDAKPLLVWAYIKTTETKVSKEGKEINIDHVGIVSYYVYDLAHTEGVKPITRKTIKVDEKHEVIASAELIIKHMPKRPKIDNNGGNRAFYAPTPDSISMPQQKAFHSKEEYYSTLFHELVHSTGHKKRLDRKFGETNGNKKAYAFEELIAEIGAAYLCGVTNIDYHTLKNSAAYLKGWASKLRTEIATDKTFLFRAILAATKAAKYIVGTTLEKHGEVVTDGKKTTEKKETETIVIKPSGVKVKASATEAIKQLLTLPQYKQLSAMFLGMFYNDFKNSEIIENINGKLKAKMYHKFGGKFFEEIDFDNWRNPEVIERAQINDEGKELIEKIKARLQTLKAKKAGTDMFPDLAGLDEETIDELINLYEKASYIKSSKSKVFIKKIDKEYAKKIKDIVGIDVFGYQRVVLFSEARHVYLMHGEGKEMDKTQKEITPFDFAMYPIIVDQFDTIKLEERNGIKSLKYTKNTNSYFIVIEEIFTREKELRIKSMFIKKTKPQTKVSGFSGSLSAELLRSPYIQRPKRTTIDKANLGKKMNKSKFDISGVEVTLQFIRQYLGFDGRNVTLDEIGAYIEELQKAIKAGEIKKTDPYANDIRLIQTKLVKVYNENLKAKSIKINIKDKLKHEEKLKGLGFVPEMIAAAAGALIQKVAHKHLKKEPEQINGLGCPDDPKCGCNEKKQDPMHGFSGVMSADKMAEVKYDRFKFNPYYKGIFGAPATNFDMCIYGDPGTGKTVFLLKLANYFAETFGPVLYVSTEEYGAPTLIDKIERFKTNNKNLFFSPKLIDPKIDLKKYKFIFIDSVNHAKINLDQYKQIREQNPDVVFVLILQTTKSGSYRGGKDWPHEVELSMKLYKDDSGKRMLNIDKDRYGNPRTVKI